MESKTVLKNNVDWSNFDGNYSNAGRFHVGPYYAIKKKFFISQPVQNVTTTLFGRCYDVKTVK